MAEEDLPAGAELHAPTESRAELAMRSRIAARLDLDIGQVAQQIGRYEVLRRLGSGGMGVVYEARDPHLDRTVALKVLRPDRMDEVDGHERLRREARTLAKLSHPNVVQIHEVGEHEGMTFVVMELVRGPTLDEWQRTKVRSLAELLAVYSEAGKGLAAAHGAGIVHRDFKPSNVLVGGDGRIRVVDFGLARTPVEMQDEAAVPTLEGSVSTAGIAGTPGYIAPEILAGKPANARSDQFSYCVALWEAVNGYRPTAWARDRRRRGNLRFSGPAWLRRVLSRGLAEQPADRWPDLATLLIALDRRPRRQVLLGLALPLVGLGVGMLVERASVDSNAPCVEPSRDFDAIWNPEIAVRLRANMLALGRTEAEALLVTRALDRQRARWLETQHRACEAAHVNSTWSTDLLETADRCLADSLQQSRDLVGLFDPTAADPPASVRALVEQLEDPRRCADLDALAREPSPTADDALVALRQSISLTSMLLAGQTRRGDAKSERLVEQARELHRQRSGDMLADNTLAEALELRATAEQWRQRPDLAWPLLREATTLARSSGDIELELRCLHRMGYLAAEQFEEPERAADFVALAEGLVPRVESDARAKFEHSLVRAELARSQQQLESAKAILLAAIGEAAAAQAVPRLKLERARLRLANLLAEQGQLDDALQLYLELRDVMAAQLGNDAADVGFLEFNIGISLHQAGDREQEAELHLRRALEILERSFGAQSIRLASPLTVLAEIEFADGRFDDALADAGRAWALQRSQLPEGHGDRGEALKVIGGAHMYMGDYRAALDAYEQMAENLVTDSVDEIAGIDCSRGWLMCRLGDCKAARPHFEAALENASAEFIRSYAKVGLANVEIVAGNPDAALLRLKDVAATLERAPVDDPALHAELGWLTARALVDADGDLADAREHLNDAVAAYADLTMPPDIADDLEELREALRDE